MPTKIEWTDETWNPVVGCEPISPGCANCYAARMAHRLAAMGRPEYQGITIKCGRKVVFNGTVGTLGKRLDQPYRWRKPRLVFVCSMSDLFHDDVPFGFIEQVHDVMQNTPQHVFQVLTKHPSRMQQYWLWRQKEYLGRSLVSIPPDNVWYGTSVENQMVVQRSVPILLQCPASVRFLSCEPLLGPVDLTRWLSMGGIHWVIVGGEYGPGARPCHREWVESLIRQCRDANVPVFVKQLGSAYRDMLVPATVRLKHPKGGDITEWPASLRVREWPCATRYI